jgi:hypothetical protein
MVLVSERRAEEGHDPVAHDLVDRTFVAMDGLHHPLENRIEQLSRFFRIALGEQPRRAFQVREEHCHEFALALQGGLGGENLLGEVLGGVDVGRLEPRRGDLGQRGGTLAAELVLQRIISAAGRADSRQGEGALAAELHDGVVLGLAPGTLHPGGLLSAAWRLGSCRLP